MKELQSHFPKASIYIVFLFLFVNPQAHSQDYKQVHHKNILIDAHNDILTTAIVDGLSFDQNLKGKTHSDLKRIKEAGMDIQIFSVWCDGNQRKPFTYANRQIDTLYSWVARNSDQMMLVKTPADLNKAVNQGKLGSMIGVEGGHMIENDLKNLDILFERGARYLTLTWNNSNPWATSAADENMPPHSPLSGESQKRGLTDFGKQVVQRMNHLGMMVDLSHVGEQTFWDAINTSTKPVIISHSNCFSLSPVSRNLKDEQILAIGKNGGVIGLNFYSGFLVEDFQNQYRGFRQKHSAERDSLLKINPDPYFAEEILSKKYANELEKMRPPLSIIVDHLDHIVKLIGVDHVGFGSDFDGITSTPKGLDDITGYPQITKELIARGYSKKDISKIMGGNFIRLFKANMN